MKRLGPAIGVSALLLTALAAHPNAAGPFDQKLSTDRRIAHVLNRVTFGPRPGDAEQVRRLGVERWIDLQLNPDRIEEHPTLRARLATLGTVNLPMWRILELANAPQAALLARPPSALAVSSLPQQQYGKLLYCSVEERLTVLAAMAPDTRRLVLAGAPQQVAEGLPDDVRQEMAAARKAEQDERFRETRRLRPPLNELLTPEQARTANRGTIQEKVALLDSLDAEKRAQVLRALPPQAFADLPALRREAMAASQPQQLVNVELIEHKLMRAVYSNRQLEEVLVDFWLNHFNVFNGKGPVRTLLTSFERDAIRPHVFGRFRDMLLATARHPAMLYYLDNWQSQVPRDDLPIPAGARRPGLNENYGRELLELHTLGVDGGYTQDDVLAVARAFTGWTIYDTQRFAEFQFNPGMHDRKEKIVLGHRIPAMGAEQDGVTVIEILSRHPSTARFISRKLAQRFVADVPPPPLVDRMAATFTRTDGDLRAVVRAMLGSPEFLSEGAWRAKLKSPLEMVISAVRALNADVTDAYALAQRIADLGQPLYGKAEPTGYPTTSDAWMSTAGLLGRINVAAALTAGRVAGVTVDVSRFSLGSLPAVARDLLAVPPSASTLAAIEEGARSTDTSPSTLAALVIGSPDFQRR
jgi:uncharacterized protein (DUF1800 family)